MNIKEEEEIKKEFQLERVVLFTDAVFAIILTIMVLEIKLPEGMRTASEEHVQEAFKEVIFKFFGYALTFGFVAKFWISHLKLFRYLKDYDSNLIVLNLVFLFCVSMFPFAVSLIAGTVSVKLPEYTWGLCIYIAAINFSLFTQALIANYLIAHKDTLCINTPDLERTFKWKVQRLNLYLTPLMVGVAVTFVFIGIPYIYFMWVFAVYGFTVGRVAKKYYPADNKGPLIVQLIRKIRIKRKPAKPSARV